MENKKTLLNKILHEEKLEAIHGTKAMQLRCKYADKYAKYKKNQIVDFKKPYMDGKTYKGEIKKVKYNLRDGIIYCLNVLKKNNEQNKADMAYYFIKEKNIRTS